MCICAITTLSTSLRILFPIFHAYLTQMLVGLQLQHNTQQTPRFCNLKVGTVFITYLWILIAVLMSILTTVLLADNVCARNYRLDSAVVHGLVGNQGFCGLEELLWSTDILRQHPLMSTFSLQNTFLWGYMFIVLHFEYWWFWAFYPLLKLSNPLWGWYIGTLMFQ